MELIPVGIFWSIALWALFQQKQVLMYLFFASMPFGSFAAIPTELTAGLTLTPTPIVAILLIGRELGSARGFSEAVDAALKPSSLLLLFIFWIVAGVATAFMPRLYAGQVEVVPVRVSEFSSTAMLAPTIQNLSQFVYISISVMTVFVFASMFRSHPMRRHAVVALSIGATMTVVTGFLDFAAQYVPLQDVLELFRTASYALLTDVEILDSKRVVGLMPEASSFGALALAFLVALHFFRRAMPAGVLRERFAPILMGLLLILIWLSTSSAAYLGLGIFGLMAASDWIWRLVASGRNPYLRRGLATEFLIGFLALWAMMLVVIVAPHVLNPLLEMFDVMVLQKTSSSSYEERSMWTRVSWDALLATHGLGVGMGGTRASNFAVALASNAGVIGATCYFLFASRCLLFQPAAKKELGGEALLSAIRWSYLPSFLASLTTGTTPDFGLFNAFYYGLAVAIARKDLRRLAVYASTRRSEKASSRVILRQSTSVD